MRYYSVVDSLYMALSTMTFNLLAHCLMACTSSSVLTRLILNNFI